MPASGAVVINRLFYFGPLDKNDRSLVVVAAPGAGDSSSGPAADGLEDPWIEVYRFCGLPVRWSLTARADVGSIMGMIRAVFRTPGDRRKQLALEIGGADWSGIEIFGFRGGSYKPRKLISVGNYKAVTKLERRHGRELVAEIWPVRELLERGTLRLPLPTALRGHSVVKQEYAYSASSDRYTLLKGFIPDDADARLFGALANRVSSSTRRRSTRHR